MMRCYVTARKHTSNTWQRDAISSHVALSRAQIRAVSSHLPLALEFLQSAASVKKTSPVRVTSLYADQTHCHSSFTKGAACELPHSVSSSGEKYDAAWASRDLLCRVPCAGGFYRSVFFNKTSKRCVAHSKMLQMWRNCQILTFRATDTDYASNQPTTSKNKQSKKETAWRSKTDTQTCLFSATSTRNVNHSQWFCERALDFFLVRLSALSSWNHNYSSVNFTKIVKCGGNARFPCFGRSSRKWTPKRFGTGHSALRRTFAIFRDFGQSFVQRLCQNFTFQKRSISKCRGRCKNIVKVTSTPRHKQSLQEKSNKSIMERKFLRVKLGHLFSAFLRMFETHALIALVCHRVSAQSDSVKWVTDVEIRVVCLKHCNLPSLTKVQLCERPRLWNVRWTSKTTRWRGEKCTYVVVLYRSARLSSEIKQELSMVELDLEKMSGLEG